MSSIGSVSLSMRADIDSLRKDLTKATGLVERFSKDGAKSAESLKRGLESAGVGAETLKRGVGNVVTGVLLMTDAFGEAGKVGKIVEQSFGAFLLGGPLAAGVSALTGVFKLMGEESAEAAKKAEDAAKRVGDEAKKQAKEVEQFWKRVNAERESAFLSETDRLRAANERLREELFPVDAMRQMENELAKARGQLIEVRGPEVTGRRALTIDEQRRATLLEERIALLETKIARDLREAGDAAVKAAEAFHAVEDAALKQADLDRKLKALSIDNTRVSGSLSDAMGIEAPAAEVGKKGGEVAGKAFSVSMAETVREELPVLIDPLWESLAQTLSGAITEGMVDGIMDGGKRMEDIWNGLVRSLLSQTLNSLVSSGLNAILGLVTGGLTGGAGSVISAVGGLVGGSSEPWGSIAPGSSLGSGALPLPPSIPGLAEGGIITRPTLALLGEGGEPEYVIPRSKMGGVNVSVSVAIQQSNLEAAADLAAAKVRQAVLESGSYARDMKRGLTKRL